MAEAAVEKTEPDTPSRPSRERKTVEHFKPTEKQEKDDKPADKQAGKGTALGDCENSTSSLIVISYC